MAVDVQHAGEARAVERVVLALEAEAGVADDQADVLVRARADERLDEVGPLEVERDDLHPDTVRRA